jgi:hypothetical protein
MYHTQDVRITNTEESNHCLQANTQDFTWTVLSKSKKYLMLLGFVHHYYLPHNKIKTIQTILYGSAYGI